MLSILDKRFQYVPAARTDIRETFARERARLAAEKPVILVAVPLVRRVGK